MSIRTKPNEQGGQKQVSKLARNEKLKKLPTEIHFASAGNLFSFCVYPFVPDERFEPSIKYFWKKKNKKMTGSNTVTDIAIK